MTLQDSTSAQREAHLLEHNIQQVLMQKQALQLELNEVSNALVELNKTKDEVFRVMGNIMMRASKESLRKELEGKKKALELHLALVEKQEAIIEEKLHSHHKNTVDKKISEN